MIVEHAPNGMADPIASIVRWLAEDKAKRSLPDVAVATIAVCLHDIVMLLGQINDNLKLPEPEAVAS